MITDKFYIAVVGAEALQEDVRLYSSDAPQRERLLHSLARTVAPAPRDMRREDRSRRIGRPTRLRCVVYSLQSTVYSTPVYKHLHSNVQSQTPL